MYTPDCYQGREKARLESRATRPLYLDDRYLSMPSVILALTIVSPAIVSPTPIVAVVPVIIIVVIVSFPIMVVVIVPVLIPKKSRTC